MHPWAQALGANQHTSSDQNMPKNALFLEKSVTITAALGGPPPNSRWPPAAGLCPRPRLSFILATFHKHMVLELKRFIVVEKK